MLRRAGTGWMDGSFGLPAGGLEAGETIHETAVREAYEEVGVRIARTALRHVHTLHSRTSGQTWIGHFFKAVTWDGTPLLCEPDKHTDLQWRSVNALPAETIPYVRQALECAAVGQSYSEYGWD